ncbi:NF038122 family metalloprotease [Bradyrhizobium sp. CB82]|uniref:NF038122 family metalloprotease n=1 Tax=Bradyrhizobium sp. CB82 TaxID=3039159 RepID=UPI0024B25137|nr:NF038122 family metalloprotease [Bradyrhizobium sp. CB82]WFU43651.1 NF038122 family metalloprotease [Bradyrhizobium sp. CB82]
MRSNSTPDQDLLSDDPFYTVVGNSIQGSYIPATSGGSSGGTATPGSVISVTSGGITINLILDAAAQAAPASFKNGLQQAVAILAANITDKITVNIKIDYSGTGGGAAAGPDSGYYENYSWVHSELINNASAGDTTFNSLPAGSTIQGQSSVAVWNAQLKLWGVLGASDTTTDDASAYFSTDIDPNLLVGVALHELTHAMGRVPYGSAPDVFDFFRFTSQNVRLFQGGATAPAAYFSLDNGATKIADYGQNSDPSDFLNSGVQGPNDPFNEYYTGSTTQGLTSVDLKQLDALGFHLAISNPIVIESFGSTSVVQIGNYYYLDPVAGGTGPELKYGGSPVTVSGLGGWTVIGAEQTGSGYDVALHSSTGNQYTVWYADSTGNGYSNATGGAVSGSSYALESFEASFHQDLNGDGTIGVITTVIESVGSTKLVQAGSNYLLNPVSGGTGPELKYGGSPVSATGLGGWAIIGAEQTGSGYEVALHSPTGDQYTVWNTDSSGNVVGNATGGVVSGASYALESLETSFHQDLNGDGQIGVVSTVLESLGSTSVVQIGNNYYLDPVAGGTGPELKYGGSPVTVSGLGGWTVIGAEQTGSGYEVALHSPTGGQYTVWNTDSSGNVVGNATGGVVSGASYALESLEPSFHQDLNGDGQTGARSTVIESFGSTSLTELGDNFFLNPVSGGTGPELKYGGSPVSAAALGGWSVIGAEQTGSGYEVALHSSTGDQYTVWSTDSSGNVVGNATGGVVSGTSYALESLEPGFHQDLNGDGQTGASSTVIESFGSTSLVKLGDNFFFNPVSGGTGPELKYGGSPVSAAALGGWAVIGAEQTGRGYEAALHSLTADQYTVWNTDSSGNVVGNATGGVVSGASYALESLEPSFHQDLNGDGATGVATAPASQTSPATQINVLLAHLLADHFLIR